MLDIDNLSVSVENKKILDNFSLHINEGEIHVLMGRNGTGKSSLAKTLMGHYLYKIKGGTITFLDTIINDLEVYKRAELGMFLCMQEPTPIEGVTNSELLKLSREEVTHKHIDYFDFINEVNEALDKIDFPKSMLKREVNVGFSGGEKKKNEILGMWILKPKFIILDELDSGLDVDSLKIVSKNINDYMKMYPSTSLLIITHHTKILEFIKPNYVHILSDGKIIKTGDYSLAKHIEEEGFDVYK